MLRKGGNLILAKFIIGPKLPHITEAYCFSVELFKQKVCIHGVCARRSFIYLLLWYGMVYVYIRPTRHIATQRDTGRERRQVRAV